MIDIDYYNLIKIDQRTLDRWIVDLHDTINSSQNYDWTISYIELVNNLENGHFDVQLDGNELNIFGIYIEDVDDETKSILLGIS